MDGRDEDRESDNDNEIAVLSVAGERASDGGRSCGRIDDKRDDVAVVKWCTAASRAAAMNGTKWERRFEPGALESDKERQCGRSSTTRRPSKVVGGTRKERPAARPAAATAPTAPWCTAPPCTGPSSSLSTTTASSSSFHSPSNPSLLARWTNTATELDSAAAVASVDAVFTEVAATSAVTESESDGVRCETRVERCGWVCQNQ
mmetsp:Transcript_4583/g.14846  ORF Transcript_4583/g.14846 Transcript_4583/m.14846 type:complete len:204 (+) Transcript_4583:699-1310(+)